MLNKVIIEVGDDKEVTVEIINGYQLNLNFSLLPVVNYKDGNIISLKVGRESLSLYDNLKVPIDHKLESGYAIQKIERLTDRVFSIYSAIGTKTKQFILPCLNFDRDYFLYDTFLQNAYVKIFNKPDKVSGITTTLVLLYRYSESELFKSFEVRIAKHPNYRYKLDPNEYEVLYIFDIPEYKEDVDKFIKGRYSKISANLKERILRFHNYSKEGVMWKILNKDSKLREQMEIQFDTPISTLLELYEIPAIEDETYYYNI